MNVYLLEDELGCSGHDFIDIARLCSSSRQNGEHWGILERPDQSRRTSQIVLERMFFEDGFGHCIGGLLVIRDKEGEIRK